MESTDHGPTFWQKDSDDLDLKSFPSGLPLPSQLCSTLSTWNWPLVQTLLQVTETDLLFLTWYLLWLKVSLDPTAYQTLFLPWPPPCLINRLKAFAFGFLSVSKVLNFKLFSWVALTSCLDHGYFRPMPQVCLQAKHITWDHSVDSKPALL